MDATPTQQCALLPDAPLTRQTFMLLPMQGTILQNVTRDLYPLIMSYIQGPRDKGSISPSYRWKSCIGSHGYVPGTLRYPSAVTTDSQGNFLVVDRDNKKIDIFKETGELLHSFGAGGETQFNLPSCAVVDHEGRIAVLDRGNTRVQLFDESSRAFLFEFPLPNVSEPRGITTDLDGNFIVSDYDHGHIHFFAPDGTFLRQFGAPGKQEGCIDLPVGVAITPENNVVVVENGARRISVFTLEGQHIRSFHPQIQGPWSPWGCDTDKSGNIIVADCAAHKIWVFSPEGEVLQSFGTKGGADHQLSNPLGVHITAKGEVIVGDYYHHRVSIFTAGIEELKEEEEENNSQN